MMEGISGGIFYNKIIFGYIRVTHTHLECFGPRGGAGGSEKVLENAFQKSGVPVGLAQAPELIGLSFSQ